MYKGVASRISSLKSSLVTPSRFLSKTDGFGFDEKLAKVYVRYQDELKRSNALDFDDLIMLTVKLLRRTLHCLKNTGLYLIMFWLTNFRIQTMRNTAC